MYVDFKPDNTIKVLLLPVRAPNMLLFKPTKASKRSIWVKNKQHIRGFQQGLKKCSQELQKNSSTVNSAEARAGLSTGQTGQSPNRFIVNC